jgi:hypothetical protein
MSLDSQWPLSVPHGLSLEQMVDSTAVKTVQP